MTFTPDQPFSTPRARVVVDAGLAPGRYRFRLQVVGTSGFTSPSVFAVVTVLPPDPRIPDPLPGPLPRPTPVPIPSPRFPP